MATAGFSLHEPRRERPEPGGWEGAVIVDSEELMVTIDLIVPEGAATGRRWSAT